MNKTLKKTLWVLSIIAIVFLILIGGFLIFFFTQERVYGRVPDEMTSFFNIDDTTTAVDDVTTEPVP